MNVGMPFVHRPCQRAILYKISIIPRGVGALGYTLQSPERDKNLHSRQELLSKLVVYMGGRVAEDYI